MILIHYHHHYRYRYRYLLVHEIFHHLIEVPIYNKMRFSKNKIQELLHRERVKG
jgi:hypothetical protein